MKFNHLDVGTLKRATIFSYRGPFMDYFIAHIWIFGQYFKENENERIHIYFRVYLNGANMIM